MNKYSDAQIEEVSKLNSEAAVLECQLAAIDYGINGIVSSAEED